MKNYFLLPGYNHLGGIKPQADFLRKRGHQTLVLVNKNCTVDYSEYADELLLSEDIFDAEVLTRELTPYLNQITGFTSIQDRLWPSLFKAIQNLNLQTPQTLEHQLNCRIKPVMRQLTHETMPIRFALVEKQDLKLAENLKRKIERDVGIPCVLKPIWGQASEMVSIVRSPQELISKLENTFEALAADLHLRPFDYQGRTWNPKQLLLVEEYIPGTEAIFEGFAVSKNLHTIGINEKFDVYEESGILCETADIFPAFNTPAELQSQIESKIHQTLKAVNFQNNCFHVEYRLHGDRVVIVEINPRPAGANITKVYQHMTGISLIDMMVKFALGEKIQDSVNVKEGHMLNVWFPSHPQQTRQNKVTEISGLEWAKAQPEFAFMDTFISFGKPIPQHKGAFYMASLCYHCKDRKRVPELLKSSKENIKFRFEPA